MIRADLGGSVKRGGGSSSGLLWMSSTCRQAMSPSAVSTRAATVWCSRASVAVWAATVPAAEPISAPTLHMPCSPDMIDLSRRFSTSMPRAFIATSDIPAVAP